MTNKIAVVVFNLGGPDAPQAVKPFLLNFFMDKNIISLPIPFRCMLASLIANKRSKAEARESYDVLGGASPLLKHSQLQAKALQKTLNAHATDGQRFKTFVSMRYWHPMAPQVVREVRDWNPDQIVFLPLYPQFSTTTSWSSFENWDKHAQQAGYTDCPSSSICCYPLHEGYISASADRVAVMYANASKAHGDDQVRILLSAHGLPEDIIRKGDPYQWQCEQSATKIIEALQQRLGLDKLDWQICYQSRVGPKKWIGPSTEDALRQAAEDGKAVVVYPHAFTQEHVETLVELDIEYKEVAKDAGILGYYRAQTVGTHPEFIEGLAAMVLSRAETTQIACEGYKTGQICPEQFSQCCQRKAA